MSNISLLAVADESHCKQQELWMLNSSGNQALEFPMHNIPQKAHVKHGLLTVSREVGGPSLMYEIAMVPCKHCSFHGH